VNEPHDEHGFDNTPQGVDLADMLRRHAPPPSNAAFGAAAVIGRLHAQKRSARLSIVRWLAPAAGIAAAVLITLVAVLPDDARIPAPQPQQPVQPAAAVAVMRGAVQPALSARLRGTSGNGWRLDAGLKDGLRVGDRLVGKDGVSAQVVAAGIFDSRVRVDGVAARGQEFFVEALTEPQQRASRLREVGGDPGALLDLGAIFDPMQMRDARMLGLSDGRALAVTEVVPAILRDFEGEPQATLAARMGLRSGDVILAVNGMQVRDLGGLFQALELTRGGMTLFTVMRGNGTLELSAK